jgi:AraC family transcriptional regulator of arabinose operon
MTRRQEPRDHMDPRIARIIAHMEDSFDRTPRVPELAAIVELSPSRFAHLFRAETGVSPGRYLHTIRMQRARVLLERTFLNVREVMILVGFRDPSHFARDFRRFHGIPPSAVRGLARNPGPAPAALLDHLMATDGGDTSDPSRERAQDDRRPPKLKLR